MSETDDLFCRVCLNKQTELIEENIPFYQNIVCECKGTVGGICHQCLELLDHKVSNKFNTQFFIDSGHRFLSDKQIKIDSDNM